MKAIKLHSAPFLDAPERGYASYISDKQQLKVFHCHDYYEIFLVDRGYSTHYVNGMSHAISVGSMCFIRPEDEHYYDECSDDFRIINILIPEPVISRLFDFLGEGFQKERLLSSKMPPCAALNYDDSTALIHELEQLIICKKIMKETSDMSFRITLFEILTRYFFPKSQFKIAGKIPQWLRWLSLEMLKKENFLKGLPALYALSGKSPEHLSRTCKRYLRKTPSQLVNDIRLEYSAKLLASSNKPIIEICEESGFDSLSYFYHRFKEHYSMSPVAFRKLCLKNEVQIYRMDDLSIKAEIPKSVPLSVGKTER